MTDIIYEVVVTTDTMCGTIDSEILGTYSDYDYAHWNCEQFERNARELGDTRNYWVSSTLVDNTTFVEFIEGEGNE